MSFDDISKLMLDEYNSNARQLQVYSMLKGMHLQNVMSENEIITSSYGLTKAVIMVKELSHREITGLILHYPAPSLARHLKLCITSNSIITFGSVYSLLFS